MKRADLRSIEVFEMVLSGAKAKDIADAFNTTHQTVITECERVVKELRQMAHGIELPVYEIPGITVYRRDASKWKPTLNRFKTWFKSQYRAPAPTQKLIVGFEFGIRLLAGMSLYEAHLPTGFSDTTCIVYLRQFTNVVLNTNKKLTKSEIATYRFVRASKFKSEKDFWLAAFAGYLKNNKTFIPLFGEKPEDFIAIKLAESTPTPKVKNNRYVKPA